MNGDRDDPGTILVLAKAPVPGRVKTRLHPPCTFVEAARIAEAALADTLRAVADVPAGRRVLVLEGRPGPWLPPRFTMRPQRGRGLDERLAAAFDHARGPTLLIGMDTPQVSAAILQAALDTLRGGSGDAVLGLAADGGWWAIGLRRPDPRVFLGVPMSTSFTGRAQAERLERLGYRWDTLPELRDVDRFDDALEVANQVPGSTFSREVSSVADRLLGLDRPTDSIAVLAPATFS